MKVAVGSRQNVGTRPRKFFLSPRRVFGMAGPVRRRTRCGRNAGYSQNPGDGSCAEPSPGFCVCSHWTGRSRAFRIGTESFRSGLAGTDVRSFPVPLSCEREAGAAE